MSSGGIVTPGGCTIHVYPSPLAVQGANPDETHMLSLFMDDGRYAEVVLSRENMHDLAEILSV